MAITLNRLKEMTRAEVLAFILDTDNDLADRNEAFGYFVREHKMTDKERSDIGASFE